MDRWVSDYRMSYIQKIKKISDTLQDNLHKNGREAPRLFVLTDYLIEHYLHGVLLIEYNQYRFQEKSKRERRTFVCYPEFLKIIKKANNPEWFNKFDNKCEFNELFRSDVGRKWVKARDVNLEEFKNFTIDLNEIFAKPIDGMCGRGARLIDLTNDSIEKIYNELVEDNCIVEEVVKQHPSIARFNSSSINTLRIVTFLDKNNKVNVIAAVIRLGRKGEVVDNFHNYGIVTMIDIDTGIIKTTGVDRDFNRYVIHPDSKIPIVGFKIPSWDKVLDLVHSSALKCPEIRYIGWDIAINQDGIPILIEGNRSADHDVTQVTDQVGKWPIYKRMIEEL